MEKETILKNIKEVDRIEGINSMGVSESYYNKYYLTKKCFTEEELNSMNEKELNNIIKLADFAGDVFY